MDPPAAAADQRLDGAARAGPVVGVHRVEGRGVGLVMTDDHHGDLPGVMGEEVARQTWRHEDHAVHAQVDH